MNKKGFTLIELIAVIIILAAITLLAVPPILETVNKNKDTINEASKRLVFTATDLILSDYMNVSEETMKNYDATICIPVNTLVNYGYLSNDIYDENSQSGIEISDIVKVTLSAGKKDKEIVKDGDCQERRERISSGPLLVSAGDSDTHKGIVYLNPKDLSVKCDETNSQIGYSEANSSGCMKFYIFDDSGSTYKMILDHNTTGVVAWNSDRTFEMKEVKTALESDTLGWVGNPRLITANEVANITNTTTFINDTSTSWFYLDGAGTNKQTLTTTTQGSNRYAWLFDYTVSCIQAGCNTAATSEIPGYWTSTASTTEGANLSFAWGVMFNSKMMMTSSNAANTCGVRPVIELPKLSFYSVQ